MDIVPKNSSTRRNFLKGALVTAGLYPLCSPLLISNVIAGTADESALRLRTLEALLRTIFPHRWLSRDFYQRVAATYVAEIEQKANALGELQRGLRLLDGSGIAPFAELPVVMRKALIHRYDQEPFFAALRWRASELIYRDPEVWRSIGYEGSSLEYGGYVERGFNDIDWLPSRTGGGS